MQQKGTSVVEALFSLAVCLLVFGTLFPLFITMMQQINVVERNYHAHRIAYNALLEQKTRPTITSNHVVYNGERYFWHGNEKRMCVEYDVFQQQKDVCFEASP